MSERELAAALARAPVPEELEAERRAWAVLRGAYSAREPVPRPRRGLRPLVALAVVAALLAGVLSPPGRGVREWLRDRVDGEGPPQPALVRLPAPGRLLVLSERGPWIVRQDGAKRLLGDYEGAHFSPRGLFVVVTAGRRVVAVEPDGDPRWSLTRPRPVEDARWAPSGFRVAYREADTLRVVVGNGEGDRLLARRVAELAPAWRPDPARNVLAYADASGSVRVVDVDSGDELWRVRTPAPPELLDWSSDGRLLLVTTSGRRHLVVRNGRARTLTTPAGHDILDAAFAPGRTTIAYAASSPAGTSSVVLGGRRIQTVEGRLDEIEFSPDGRWLLAAWSEANQLLFLRVPGVRRIVSVEDVRREFDPGGSGAGAFPRPVGWCCAAEEAAADQ